MSEDKCLEFWKPYKGDGTVFLSIDHAIDSCKLSVFLGKFLADRYFRYQTGHELDEEDLNEKVISGDSEFLQFYMNDFAQAFLPQYASQEIADYLATHTNQEDYANERVLEEIANLDKSWVHGSYESGPNWTWQLKVPALTRNQIKELIPKKHWSRSKYAKKLSNTPRTSPLLQKGTKILYQHFETTIPKIIINNIGWLNKGPELNDESVKAWTSKYHTYF